MKKLTREEFIKKSIGLHNNKYDYSLVEYYSNRIKVKIFCKNCNKVFEQTPASHLFGHGCIKCGVKQSQLSKIKTKNKFISDARKIHELKYDYGLVEYKNNKTKVKIICKKHGIFEQRPDNHLQGADCPNCSIITTEKYIEKAIKIHGNKYDYSLVEYINSRTKVKIICREHGVFEQKASSHLEGHGCPICKKDKVKKRFVKNKDYFIKKAIELHGTKYDYSLVKYINNQKKVEIICPSHGIFLQSPSAHYKYGCKLCCDSIGEKKIEILLNYKKIKYDREKRFFDCKDVNTLPFDFYLPEYNICIEYDGILHFKSFERFGGENKLKLIKKHDKIKNIYCKNNNIRLIRINYKEDIEEKINEKLWA